MSSIGLAQGKASRSAPIALIAVVFMGSTITTPLYALYARTFGFGPVMLTLIYATYVIGNLAALLFFGGLSDQIGRRRAALIALAAAGAAGALFLVAGGAFWLFAGRALSGFAIGIVAGTGTAWLVEIEGEGGKARAALVSISANLAGLALGPLIAGLLADEAPAPLRLSYIVYLLLVGVAVVLVMRSREPDVARSGTVVMTPRIGVPEDVRGRFAGPAITGFCTFSFVGFYAALVPGLVGERLGYAAHTIGGGVVSELFVAALVVNFATRSWSSRSAMLGGLVIQIPALVLLVMADRLASLPILLVASAIAGAATAPGYRGGMQVVNEIAPADARAALVSSYMLICFLGNSLPVIGVALLGQALADPVAAVTIFALVVGMLAASAIALSLYAPHHERKAGSMP